MTARAAPTCCRSLKSSRKASLRDGALDKAAALRQRALDIALAAFGCNSPSAAQAMGALALSDIDRRRYLDAEPLLIIAERVLRKRVAADQPEMATIFAGLARIALARGDTRPAEAWATRAVYITRHNPMAARLSHCARSAPSSPRRGASMKPSGSWARRWLRTASSTAPTGQTSARSLSQLANLYLRGGRAGEALPLFEQATAIDQGRLGATHPFIADDLHDLGLAYEALKRPDEARDALIAAIDILERGAGRETPRVAYAELELSRLYRQQGNAAAADSSFREARRILNKAEAEEHRRERQV